MKVLLFTDSDVFAGTERHILDLACALRDEKLDVTVACPIPSPLATQCQNAQVQVLDVPKKGLIDWKAVRVLRRLLKSEQINVVHAHNARTALASALAVILARRGRLVTTQHALWHKRTLQNGLKAKVSLGAHRWLSQQTHCVIAISDAVRDLLVGRGDNGEKITVVRNGIPDVSLQILEDAEKMREELKIGDAPFVFCAARLEHEKDVTSLIEAMKVVVEQTPNVQCLVAGEGVLRDELQSQIDELKLSSNVRLLGFRDDVLDLMRACDVFVLPSLAEPFGLVLIEAMALSKPVVATDEGGPREIVQDGESGFLVAPSSPRGLADALLKLLNDEKSRAQMGQKSRARYKELFTAQRMAQEIADVYRKALK